MLNFTAEGITTFGGIFSVLLAARVYLQSRQTQNPAGIYLLKGVWFVGIVYYEWLLLKDFDWLPKYLGGPGSLSIWTPENDVALELLYQASLAYHGHSCAAAVIFGAKPEMHFHHGVTLSLILLSDVMGYRRIGTIVMLLHDVPDIASASIKGAIACKSLPMTLVSYVGVLATWGYFRLYLFSQLVASVFYEAPADWNTRACFGALLSSLLLLHVYWYTMFLVMLHRYVTKGRIKDVSEDKQAYPQGHHFVAPTVKLTTKLKSS